MSARDRLRNMLMEQATSVGGVGWWFSLDFPGTLCKYIRIPTVSNRRGKGKAKGILAQITA